MATESKWIVGRSQAISQGGMVAAKTPEAARAGAQVLRDGGNAIDAAVVTALVAGVSEQWMNGIGGGGYLVRHDPRAGDSDVVAYPMISPRSARPDMFELAGAGRDAALFGWPLVVNSENIVGHRSICVPGTVDGLSKALERWGSISWAAALDPAIACAEDGFPVHWHTTARIASDLANLRRFDATADIVCPNGVPPWSPQGVPAARIRQPDLGRSLRILADRGPRELYEGELASTIVTQLNAGGGDFCVEDFTAYAASFESPTTVTYHGHRVDTIGNGTGGTTLAQSFLLLDQMISASMKPASAELLDAMARAFAAAFADRFAYLADPKLVEVPLAAMLSEPYIAARVAELADAAPRRPRAGSRMSLGVSHTLETSIPDFTSAGSTTHLSVIDRDGVAVALTQTQLSAWGSRVTIPGTGILMNNGMMWFDPEPGRPNSIEGGKRPLSNMAPAIISNGNGIAALGASGGRRIMNCVAQIAMQLIDQGAGMQDAVAAPRIDRSTLALIASDRFDPVVLSELRTMGHDVAVKDETLLLSEFASPACVRFDGTDFTGGVDLWYYPATASGA